MSKILVIDDEESVRENIGEFLELNNFEVIYANDGVQGIELAKAELPDLIICDISMPEVDGYGVLQAIRRNSRTYPIPFLFLTAFTRRYEQRKGMNLGADDYITKPYNTGEILLAVKTKLNKYHELKERFSGVASSIDANLSMSIPLNMREPLDLIHQISRTIIENYEYFDDKDVLSMVENINDSVIALNHTLENYTMYVDLINNINEKELSNIECSEPEEIIRYLLELYRDRYTNVNEENIYVNYNRLPLCITDDHFEKIFDLIFEIAFKNFVDGSRISVRSEPLGHNLVKIEIKFAGRGFSNDQIKAIANFNPENPNHFANFNPSSGLILIREILKYYNGSINIFSRPDYDTTITIHLQRSFMSRRDKHILDDETLTEGQENYFG